MKRINKGIKENRFNMSDEVLGGELEKFERNIL